MWSGMKGYGSKVYNELETALRKHSDKAKRQNIYVMSVIPALGFYYKMGFQPISTPDAEGDEDYPSALTDGSMVGWWAAKPLAGEVVDQEEIYHPRVSTLGYFKQGRRIYHTIFKEPTPSEADMREFIENTEETENGDEWLAEMAMRLRDDWERDNLAYCIGFDDALNALKTK